MSTKIILTGYMGSGKTSIGKILSNLRNIPFYDLDEIIEQKEGLSIAEIFNQKGEIYFRKKEHEIFNDFIKNNHSFVLSLGGGTPCYANNHLLLQHKDVESFFLKANISTLTLRLKNTKSSRPLLHNVENLEEFIGAHVLERSYYYNFAKHSIRVDDKSLAEIANEIHYLV